MEADCCFIQAADDTDSAGLRCFGAVPLAEIIKDILEGVSEENKARPIARLNCRLE